MSKEQQLAVRCAASMLVNDAASKALGMDIMAMAEGYARVGMRVRDDMINGYGSCHGGMLFSLADSAFAFACNSANQAAVAASCNIDFIRPAFKDDALIAEAERIYEGKRSGVYQVRITNQANKLIAIFKGNSAFIGRSVLAD